MAVATHDPPLAREALRRLRRAGTPCEHELLLGLPMRAALRALRNLAVRARIYVPFGVAWAPYAIEQAQKHPHLAWWVVRDALFGRVAFA